MGADWRALLSDRDGGIAPCTLRVHLGSMTHSLPSDVLETVRAALGSQYEIERVIGSGAMGSVLLGRDRTLERSVAIKVINPDLAATSSFRQRFLQEARTIARLRHDSIVGVHAAGEATGVLYFVMEFVAGESLREALDREGRMTAARAAPILRDLAEALGYAHRNGVIHRDIKPENILIERETGRARLTDFGISRSLAAAGERMTGTGMSVGTPAYMSPEQAAGEREVDGRSDLYCLGLVGYEMLAGAPAFTGKTLASVVMKQLTEQPAPLLGHGGDVPPALAAVIHRSLAKDPDERWPDGDAMARAIDSAVAGKEAVGLVGHSSGSSARRRPLLVALALVALLVLGPTAWYFARGRSGIPDGVDPRKSFIVVPFTVRGDPSLAWLRDGSVSMLALNLAQWRDITVVEYERSLDLLRDADLDGAQTISLEDAQGLARRAGVWTIITGEITRAGDSLTIGARMLDVASGKRVEGAEWEVTAGASADPRRVFDQLALKLLGLVGAPPVELALAKTTTGSLGAYRHYLSGVRALNEWRLEAADSALGRAVAADSTFALAWYKRSLASGWRRVSDTSTATYARMAMSHGARLPDRERNLVEGNFEQQQQNWQAAQQRYVRLLARDSTDAEAWYALGDAYFHDQDPTRRAENRTRSLAAFHRTLALDSTFHLAYSHKVDIYAEGARDGSGVIIENDTIRILSSDTAQQFARPRIDAARRRARELVVRNAEQWVYTDADAAPAYLALSEAYVANGDYARAVETLQRAMARPSTRQPELAYRIASYQLGARSAEALESLRRALREQPADSLRTRAGARRFQIVLASANVALASGALNDVDQVLQRVQDVDPNLPGSDRSPRPFPTARLLGPYRAVLTAGLDVNEPQIRREIAAAAKELEAIPGKQGEQTRGQAIGIVYAGYMATRDASYLTMVRRWTGREPTRGYVALAAIEAGDTARAVSLASRFPRGDTVQRVQSDEEEISRHAEAEVLTRIGDFRGALATLEGMDPKTFSVINLDPRWALYPRTLLDRGELHERLGEREQADSMYSRVIALWKDADAKGRPLPDLARAKLAALRDAPATVPVRR